MEINLSNFYLSLITILIIIILGFILGKIKWLSEHTNKQLINLLLMVFMPVTLFNAFPVEYSAEYRDLFLQGLLGGLVVMPAMIILAKIVYNKKFFSGDLHSQSQFSLVFNNATFLGYPIISAAFGLPGVLPYCGFIIVFNFALFSYGVWLFEHKINFKFFLRTITNPNIIAVILGLLLFFLRLQLPQPLTDATIYLGNITTPLSLLCIGYMLSAAKLKELLKDWKLFITAAIQLTVAPLATWGILTLLHFPTEVIIVCALIQALPTATSLGLFAEKYGNGRGATTASELVVISTLMSMITLPLISLVIMH